MSTNSLNHFHWHNQYQRQFQQRQQYDRQQQHQQQCYERYRNQVEWNKRMTDQERLKDRRYLTSDEIESVAKLKFQRLFTLNTLSKSYLGLKTTSGYWVQTTG